MKKTDNNRFALSALEIIIRNPNETYNPFFIYSKKLKETDKVLAYIQKRGNHLIICKSIALPDCFNIKGLSKLQRGGFKPLFVFEDGDYMLQNNSNEIIKISKEFQLIAILHKTVSIKIAEKIFKIIPTGIMSIIT